MITLVRINIKNIWNHRTIVRRILTQTHREATVVHLDHKELAVPSLVRHSADQTTIAMAADHKAQVVRDLHERGGQPREDEAASDVVAHSHSDQHVP